MDKTIGGFFQSLLSKLLKLPAGLALAVGIILATSFFILSEDAYINVPGNRLLLELPPFQDCEVTFHEPTTIQWYAVQELRKNGTDKNTEVPWKVSYVKRKSRILQINNLMNQTVISPLSSSQFFLVNIISTDSMHLQIEALSIDGKQQDLNFVFSQQLKSRDGEFIKYRYIRKILANLIFHWNDKASNWVLTILFFSILYLIGIVISKEVQAYLYSDSHFKEYLNKLLEVQDMSSQNTDSYDKYVAEWAKWDIRFQFLQALGPAIGFILTVTSLVQALHPALSATNDLDKFLTGIHVAMISTFLGLFLRIVALEGARVNNVLMGRAELLFVDTKTIHPEP